MITIKEKSTIKMPGVTSLFLEFDYNKDIIDCIKSSSTTYYYDKKNKVWELPLTSLYDLLRGLNLIDDIKLEWLKEKSEKSNNPIVLPKFKTKPFEYQEEGIKYGLLHNKWLLLDAPGLGKSLQILYIIQELIKKKEVSHCLVICGVNTLKANWKKEIEKHSNLSCRILGEKSTKTGRQVIGGVEERISQLKSKIKEKIIITNIETLRDDRIVKLINEGPNDFEMVVVDEIHQAKNPSSQQGKNLLKLKKAKYKIGATGTLLMNSPLDAYLPLKWLGVEKANFSTFKYYYCNYGGPFNNLLIGFKHLDILKDQLDNVSLRRTKDILGLPPKSIINEYIEMNPSHRKFYDNLISGMLEQVDRVHISDSNLLSMVARLRQSTALPSILTSENIKSSKIERAKDLVDQIISNGEKVVIFSTFKDTAKQLYNELKEYNPSLNTGDFSDIIISENVDRFQTDDSNKVFIATWQKCGTGITLTAASYAIFIDTPWTDAVYSQAQDRIYRIGSNKPVTIYNLVCTDTIDERVLEIVEDKSAISDYVVDDKVSPKTIDSLRKWIIDL